MVGEGQRAGEPVAPGREERAVGLEHRRDPGVGEVPPQRLQSFTQRDGVLVPAVVEDADAVADPDVPETPGQRGHVAEAGRRGGGVRAQRECGGEGKCGVDAGPGREQAELGPLPRSHGADQVDHRVAAPFPEHLGVEVVAVAPDRRAGVIGQRCSTG